MKRLFCAVEVPATIEIYGAVDYLKQNLATQNVSWVNPANYHITLKFFGETENQKLLEIVKALKQCTQIAFPFSFNVKGCGFFGKKNNPSVIWLGIQNTSGLSDLYKIVNEALLPIGYLPEKQVFVPHLTVGRIKIANEPAATDNLASFFENKILATIKVDSFVLKESTLRPKGPIYSDVERFCLGNYS